MKYLLFFITMLYLGACCKDKPEEIARYPLTATDKSIVPYKTGDSIVMLNSLMQKKVLKIERVDTLWEKSIDFCEWGCCSDYTSIQHKIIELSDDTVLDISIFMYGAGSENYIPLFDTAYYNHLEVFINGYILYVSYNSRGEFLPDTTDNFYTSITINDKLYHNVIQKSSAIFEFGDKTGDRMYIYYNKQYGILKIEEKDETWFIDK